MKYTTSGNPSIIMNNQLPNENNLEYTQVIESVRHLSGKIFTLLDASITNEKQLKSMKDIIRNQVADTFSIFSGLAFGHGGYLPRLG